MAVVTTAVTAMLVLEILLLVEAVEVLEMDATSMT
jgi:hypothetical protein